MNEELEFKLPIYYLHDKSDLIKTLKIDLEMDTTQNSIYEYLFEKKSGLFSVEASLTIIIENSPSSAETSELIFSKSLKTDCQSL